MSERALRKTRIRASERSHYLPLRTSFALRRGVEHNDKSGVVNHVKGSRGGVVEVSLMLHLQTILNNPK